VCATDAKKGVYNSNKNRIQLFKNPNFNPNENTHKTTYQTVLFIFIAATRLRQSGTGETKDWKRSLTLKETPGEKSHR